MKAPDKNATADGTYSAQPPSATHAHTSLSHETSHPDTSARRAVKEILPSGISLKVSRRREKKQGKLRGELEDDWGGG